VRRQLQAKISFYNLWDNTLLLTTMTLKLACRVVDENKMLLLIISSMYDQYREEYSTRWF
jgi:hypothetical protein